MRRSALLLAALAVSLAAALAVGVARGAPLPPPPPMNTPLYVSIGDGQATEGALGAMKITAWGVLPAGEKADIYWSTTSGGSGKLGLDYATQSGEYEMAAGSVNCMVRGLNDTIYEPNRTFKVHIWSPDRFVVITRSTGTFTILDDDPVPTAHIGDQSPSWVYEGGDLTWTISLSNPSYLPVTVSLDGADNVWTTLLPADYDGTIPTSVTIPEYGSSASFTIHTHTGITSTYKTVWIWMTGVTNGKMPAVDYVDAGNQDDCWGYGTVWADV